MSDQYASDLTLDCDGILTGCDQSQEWLLPWWWMNLRLHDGHPVTFIDFGNMSKAALDWCKGRGAVISLEADCSFVAGKEKINPQLALIWETIHTHVWQMRSAWFKKPFALLQSPYKRTLWLDLDCQVRGQLDPLFDQCDNEAEVAMKREEDIFHEMDIEQGLLLPGEQIYNSGVLVYRKGAQILQDWASQALTHNRFFIGDQQLLSRIIFIQQAPLTVLPAIYNWRMDLGPNRNALILHWLGRFKNHIQTEIELLNQQFFIDLSLVKK
ncbi:hypothetical protein [Candidatus Protochlamydia phocaeensis]|uniref:hypothetical protein n=1 Tax=Candidatus Protochlamydia phocaeensis TaxID=1414722 RepID=UPI000839AEEB|nr:hypothetical protein [Candidatus Protochlamydia phocaeensis]